MEKGIRRRNKRHVTFTSVEEESWFLIMMTSYVIMLNHLQVYRTFVGHNCGTSLSNKFQGLVPYQKFHRIGTCQKFNGIGTRSKFNGIGTRSKFLGIGTRKFHGIGIRQLPRNWHPSKYHTLCYYPRRAIYFDNAHSQIRDDAILAALLVA